MQTKTGVIFLQKTKFQLYSPLISNILEFNFVSELVRDYDIVNKELFENLLKTFLVNNKIPAGSFVIMIGDSASFVKDFAGAAATAPPVMPTGPVASATDSPTLEDLQTQANQFIEHIPFDIVASRTYPLLNGVRAYATNQEMFDVIKDTMEKQGFLIHTVIPSFAFGNEMSMLTALNINAINTIFQKLNLVKEYNLLSNPKSPLQDFMASSTEEKDEQSGIEIDLHEADNKKGNKPIVLISAITVILLILIGTGVILFLQFANPPYKPPATPEKPAAAAATIPTVAPDSSGTVLAKNLTVQIVNSSASPSAATDLQTALTPIGFKEITTSTQEGLATVQPLIIFSPNVTPEIKESVTAEVKKILPTILGQDKSDATTDIVIITGK